jgi:CheY-like chemotaxis protein
MCQRFRQQGITAPILMLTTKDDSADQVQLLVLDVEMPEANGLDRCRVLRADDQWRHLPILFLTVHEDAQPLQQAFGSAKMAPAS